MLYVFRARCNRLIMITCSCKLPVAPLSWRSRRGSRLFVPPSWRRTSCKIRFWAVRARSESALHLAGTSSDLSSSSLSRCCRHSPFLHVRFAKKEGNKYTSFANSNWILILCKIAFELNVKCLQLIYVSNKNTLRYCKVCRSFSAKWTASVVTFP